MTCQTYDIIYGSAWNVAKVKTEVKKGLPWWFRW